MADTPFPPLKRECLLEEALPAANPTVRLIKGARIKFAPSQPTGLHRHPISTVGVVTAGSFILQLEGKPGQLLKTGDSFFEPPVTRFSSSTTRRRASLPKSSAFIWLTRRSAPRSRCSLAAWTVSWVRSSGRPLGAGDRRRPTRKLDRRLHEVDGLHGMNSQHFGSRRQSWPHQATYDEAIMSSDRTMASALLYLLLGLWLGPNKALHVALLITLVFAWYQVSRGIPLVGLALFYFFRGLLIR